MASNQKEVKVKVATEEELSGVEALELRINKLKKQQLQLNINAKTEQLDNANNSIEEIKRTIAGLEAVPPHLGIDIDESEINKLKTELAQLGQETLDLELSIETDELNKAKLEVEELENEEIEVQLRNQSAMEAIDQIGQGFDRLKQGAAEVGQQFGGILESAGRMEQTESFLSMNMGADQAKKTLKDIRSVTDALPGDDVALQNLLSQAAMKDATADFQQMGNTAANYMAAMQNFGKTSTETQQDLMNYILAGNTAEIERSPILQAHIDKLKEGNTVQERSLLLQEALNEEGWMKGDEGIANQEIYNNKLQTFNDMLERGKMNLGEVFLKGSEGAMDFIMTLDDSTNGLVGMGVALAGFATPLTDTVMGLGQMATGFKSLKDISDFTGITDKFNKLKDTLGTVKTKVLNLASSIKKTLFGAFTTLRTTLTNSIIPALKNAGLYMLDLGKKALTAGANALKSAGMWIVEKTALVAHKIASWASAAAQWALNIAMDANPIMLVVLAIIALVAILTYLYFNNEQVRTAIDGLGQTFIMVGQIIYSSFVNAINWIIGALQNLWNYIFTLGGLLPENVNITGNQIIDTILRVLAFLTTLPLQIGMIFINIIAKALGFGDNFAQRMLTAASNSVSRFMSQISQLPGKLWTELNNMLSAVGQWAATLPQKFWEAGVNAVKNFLNALGIHSPGIMQRMLIWEITEMGKRVPDESRKLLSNVSTLGSNIVDSFGDPTLGLNYEDTMNSQLESVTTGNNANGNSYNFYHYGDMDNEERMEKFVDAVIRRLHFENSTAGRTV